MSINLDAKFCGSEWSEEFDCVPLRLRSKILLSKVLRHDGKPMRNDSFVDREEDKDHNDKVIHTMKQSGAAIFATSSGFHNYGSSANVPASEAVGGPKGCYPNRPASGKTSSKTPVSSPRDCSGVSAGVRVLASKLKHESAYEFDDDLDNVFLGERRRMLISRKLIQSSGSCIAEQNNVEKMSDSAKAVKLTASLENQDFDSIQHARIPKISNSSSRAHDLLDFTCLFDGTLRGYSLPPSIEFRASPTVVKCGSFGVQQINTSDVTPSTSSLLPSLAKVKDEPVDISELRNEGKSDLQNNFTSSQKLCIKSEPLFFDSVGDEVDHLPLIERVRLILSGAPKPSMDILDNPESLKDNVESITINRPLKRRKTATNSVETALEEDAPELLKVLIERGIGVDEMKLYGEEDSDGDLDDSLMDDSFAELEAVILQLFPQRESFLKFPLLRTKGAKISYCLACLLSLVEQTRFLRKRKWPVEWGWCRDLQSFIFVFHRHNRIVLERPEYGYATYFFELLNSVPAAWQIKRLVTALKLTSCGRFTLMENKPLVVGEDLSEGEARVLAEYGWTPNTGLATMLNYCDRVYHDRNKEMDSSEWKSKIGKQLVNGYNGGHIVSKNLPKNLIEEPWLEEDEEDVQVKLEQ